MVNETEVMQTLSYLKGERTIPSTATEGRRDFIQRSLEEIYRAYPWPFASNTATLSVVDYTATLPATFDAQHKATAWFYAGDVQTQMYEINAGDTSLSVQGDRNFWLEPQSDGTFIMKLKDNDITQVVVKHQTLAPDINASVYTPFSDRMTIALGARRYDKLGENPDADISQDEALFQKRLNENIAASQVNRPLKRNRKIYYANGYRLGEG